MRVSANHERLMRTVRFHYRLGIEFTTIPPVLYHGRSYFPGGNDYLCNEFHSRISVPVWGCVHNDPGCIEAASHPLRTWGDVIKFSSECLRAAKELDCKQDSPYSTGGGGHIHISRRHWYDNTWRGDQRAGECSARVQAWLTHHPWVTWAFNDPSDNTEAKLGFGAQYNRAASDASNNVEFRFFDSAVSVEQQIEHVAFATRLLKVGSKFPHSPFHIVRLNRPSLKAALAGWKQTIEELALPWKLYQPYSRNIRERYQLGRRYLN